MAFNGNGAQAAEQIEAIGKGFKFSIDIDTPLSTGHRIIAKSRLIAHLKDANADWEYQIFTLKSEGKIKVVETRPRRR